MITVYVLIFVSIYFCELLEMHSWKISLIFIFVVPEGQICNFSHILCQYECDDVLDGFWGPGDGYRSDTGSETVPGQIFTV